MVLGRVSRYQRKQQPVTQRESINQLIETDTRQQTDVFCAEACQCSDRRNCTYSEEENSRERFASVFSSSSSARLRDKADNTAAFIYPSVATPLSREHSGLVNTMVR